MNTNIDGQLYDITRRRTYSNIADQLLYSLSKSVYNKTSYKVWVDVEIPVGDVVYTQVSDNISDKLYNYEYWYTTNLSERELRDKRRNME